MARTITAARVKVLLGSALDRSPAYLALADGLRLLVSDGRLSPGTRLPSERELTAELGLSRTTVTRAYDHLRERGYLVSRQGSGSVASLPAGRLPRQDPVLAPGDAPEGPIDLTCAASAAPPGVTAAYEAAVEQLPAYLSGTGYFPSGLPALKEALARRYVERGLPTVPEQIVVTCGALAAGSVAARALTGTGDRVLVESPSYPNALASLARSGVRVVGAPVDPGGWDVEALVATLRQVAPTTAYLIPDFQNPTGLLMPAEQRAELGTALTRARTTAVVDETLVEMALDDVELPPPMASFADDCVSIGSASKAFWGGLRIGWLRAPLERVGALVSARLSMDLGAPLLEQLVLVDLLTRREEVLRHRREQLLVSRTALTSALEDRLPEWTFHLPAGGLALWCELPEPLSSALTAAAEQHRLLLAAGPSFAPEGGLERFLRIPYTRPAEELTEAVARLALAWDEAQDRRTTAPARSPLVA
ncbi:MAG TPA: PLP-dependent aminotransferase family protein [Nocardioidaceae bacterium]|nr:PLP-dependent aminotransferase family protein [Nocardioidaceae bacterium]